MDQKTAKKLVEKGRAEGKSDQEIYNELSTDYASKKNLALLITGTATTADRQKYKMLNNVLIALLGVTLAFRLIAAFYLISSGEWATVFFLFLGMVLTGLVIYAVFNYMGAFYKPFGFLSALSVVKTLIGSSGSMLELIDLALLIPIPILCFYLGAKLFPNFKPNKLKKDVAGAYILN
ncbi:MAG: hypothetical protein QM802_18480 [Agriterribacter sp.]